jgi:hypothetical protein
MSRVDMDLVPTRCDEDLGAFAAALNDGYARWCLRFDASDNMTSSNPSFLFTTVVYDNYEDKIPARVNY